MCFGCLNNGVNSTCSGSGQYRFETCQPGEVCAFKALFGHSDIGGCLALAICQEKVNANLYQSCCNSTFCNLQKNPRG
ncbi:hypothetical protein RRG08_046655 [Elysia crispata]|uniref:Uncharacterized protein n=1 Tax=Elysia crispata TaxID=231223 RepID=A0AAE1E2Z3_9GAST|nr:hypothetical protein RRG08_046655 [Elysia crispata]